MRRARNLPGPSMISAEYIVKQIRRSLLIRFAVYVTASALLAAVVVLYSADADIFRDFFIVFFLAVIFAVVVVYPGKYVPTTNRHESLLNKYGGVYLAEAENAISKLGMDRMLNTSWFETYAAELCKKEMNGVARPAPHG